MNPAMHPSFEPRLAVLAWLPLLGVLAVVLLSAGGIRLVQPADAASTASGSVIITGTVDKDVQIDASACTGSALAIGSITPGDPMVSTTADCPVAFGSNNSPLGASLTVTEDPAGGAGPAMKCSGGGCGTASLADYSGATWAATTGSWFGTQLRSASGAASAAWSLDPQTYPVNAEPAACTTASTATGTCAFRFAASADNADPPGAYQALVQFTAQAN